MKKTIVALTVLASGTVFAQVAGLPLPPTSSVSGFTQSASAASGNQVSTQAGNARSANFAGAFSSNEVIRNNAESLSHAETSGFTHAGALAGGTGPGSSFSQAAQAGRAVTGITSIAPGLPGNPGATLITNAFTQVGTASQAAVGSAPGAATGTSFAVARNDTSGFVSGGGGGGGSSASGNTSGLTIMNMAVPSSGSGAAFSFGTLGGGVGAIQAGSYSGTNASP